MLLKCLPVPKRSFKLCLQFKGAPFQPIMWAQSSLAFFEGRNKRFVNAGKWRCQEKQRCREAREGPPNSVHPLWRSGRYRGAGAKGRKTIPLNQTRIATCRSGFRDRILLQTTKATSAYEIPSTDESHHHRTRREPGFLFSFALLFRGRSGGRVAQRPSRTRAPPVTAGATDLVSGSAGGPSGGAARAALGGEVMPAPGNPSEPWQV